MRTTVSILRCISGSLYMFVYVFSVMLFFVLLFHSILFSLFLCIGRAAGKRQKRRELRTYDSDKAAHIVFVVASQHAESAFPATAAAATA